MVYVELADAPVPVTAADSRTADREEATIERMETVVMCPDPVSFNMRRLLAVSECESAVTKPLGLAAVEKAEPEFQACSDGHASAVVPDIPHEHCSAIASRDRKPREQMWTGTSPKEVLNFVGFHP